jgi:Ca-activated chloride channel family protein
MLKWWQNIEFANPEFFWLLVIVPFLIGLDLLKTTRFQSRLLVSTTSQTAPGHPWLFQSPKVLKYLGFVFLLLALARPQLPLSWKNIKTEGIDIVIAMDVSGSMLAEDLKPSRIEASKNVAIDFIKGRVNDRIGLVVYAGESFTQCPLTTDHAVLLNLFKDVKNGIIEDGTAIGSGLANAVNRLKESDAKSKVVILLTDGTNNSGSIPPVTAAEIAQQFDVRVYTIGVGTEGMAKFPFKDQFTGRTVYQDVPVKIDEDILKEIAKKTGGKYFRATDNESLGTIYEEIDLLEKTITEQTEYEEKDEQFYWFVIASLIAFVVEYLVRKSILKSVV